MANLGGVHLAAGSGGVDVARFRGAAMTRISLCPSCCLSNRRAADACMVAAGVSLEPYSGALPLMPFLSLRSVTYVHRTIALAPRHARKSRPLRNAPAHFAHAHGIRKLG